MVLANRYFKSVSLAQTSSFSPNTVFHSLHCSQKSLPRVCFFSFLWSLSGHCTFTSVFEIFKSPMVTDFPRVIIISSVLFRRSKAAYWLCWYKRYVTKVFCVYRKLFRNRSQWTVNLTPCCKPEHTEMACVSSWMSGKETSTKKLYLHMEKDWLDTVATVENLTILYAGASINWFLMGKLREARSERETDSSRSGFNNSKKSNKKKQVKFVSLLDVLLSCLFQLYLS